MPVAETPAVDDALARSVIYRTLSVGFQRPTDAGLRQMGAHAGFPILTAALQRLDARGGARTSPAAASLRALVVPGTNDLESTFVRLFGHTTRGLVCACEVEYGPEHGFQQPQALADIVGYYLAFGLRPAMATDTRLDHIACECEFMDFLNRKQAVLIADPDGSPDRADTLAATVEAERTFLRDHLGRFGRAFATHVAREDAGGYFGALAGVLQCVIEAECARVGVCAGPIDLAVSPDLADETPMLCGTTDDLIQIQRSPASSYPPPPPGPR